MHPAHHRPHVRVPQGAFGEDRFGRLAEQFARAFGTPVFLAAQTLLVGAWLLVNGASWGPHWDPYPFILLNLLFSTQAAYAAPLILLAQTRQEERDRAQAQAHEAHSDAILESHAELTRHNAELMQRVADLATDLDRLATELSSSAHLASGGCGHPIHPGAPNGSPDTPPRRTT